MIVITGSILTNATNRARIEIYRAESVPAAALG